MREHLANGGNVTNVFGRRQTLASRRSGWLVSGRFWLSGPTCQEDELMQGVLQTVVQQSV
jgi:hypothetical protein